MSLDVMPVRWCDWKNDEIPEGFCELNSGVLGIRRCSSQRALVRYWLRLYDFAGIKFDQATLRAALWASTNQGLRTWVLPSEYNLRTQKHRRRDIVKIVHGNYLRNNVSPFLVTLMTI